MRSIYDFIQYTRENPDEFRNYCEIVMGIHGEIYLARPNHQRALLALAAYKNKMFVKEYESSIPRNCGPTYWIISKEKFIAIWYDRLFIPVGGMNRFQKRSIKLLQEAELISNDLFIDEQNEYQAHLYRKKIYGID